ncbi:WD repeat protein [Aspergillus saccharolyticus JOP 1030-1]|uniref:WD40 repeat-like protein n=1 Tax=Aspergillus saccharolyticus JOP 1030-1 TaxID=1450539 RepID=A0A318ZHL0_9EURO|nr:WD40 repeat-like protein [Aspergillus saccharolyticus JOP 1030-1]PYH46425.1 WD40 repeat-like protein [Aspergillus saccharolyticus JOP 1030-1]
MHTLKAVASSSLSLAEDHYIYSIAAAAPGSFAVISSDDSLRVFNADDLSNSSIITPSAHEGVTSLRSYDAGQQLLATTGRDGKVKLWDMRRGKSPVVELHTLNHAPALSLACSAQTNDIAAGTEYIKHDNVYQAVVAFWYVLSPIQPRLQYIESHNDDVTELQYHPTLNHIALSGSTDGLVNIYNTNITDEDDALVQVINHGSVHHAGWLDEKTVYALSHDEDFAIHPMTDPDDQTAGEAEPTQFNDLRQPLNCEYVVQLCQNSQGQYIAAGNKLEQRLDLVPLVSSPSWQFDQTNSWRLPGAHGEEVIRSVYVDEQSQSVLTCGEDGCVRVWKPEAGDSASQTDSSAKGTRQKEKRSKNKDRFKPY